MIAEAISQSRKTRVGGFRLPSSEPSAADRRFVPPHEIDLPHPAIESLPEFVCRVESHDLQHGVRHYNGSIARHEGRIFMAYRFESFRALSRVGLCELDSDFRVLRDAVLEPVLEKRETQIEDPHMASVGGKLIIVISNVVREFPPTCRQRVFTVDPRNLRIEAEIDAPFGMGIEKNWTPFELPDGSLGIVYKQRARMVIRVGDKEGWAHESPYVSPAESSLSGRTGPLRISDGLYLEFVGGHVRIQHRGTRYWFGALIFEAKPPFKVVDYTKEPLVWASEASPTLFNPIPKGGHPVCILPAGAMISGEDVHVSCGVNDSYVAILKFSLRDILRKMSGRMS